ncbi:MAG: hypothetical protein F6J95_023615 [Leptolyngbya sp. SIO1E4]|nr:hypothetical protein [Leptolyngbya sp. SIO1E4]
MAISTFLANNLNDLVFGGTAYTPPTNISVQLWNASAQTAYDGYSAQTIAVGTGTWNAAATDGSGRAVISPTSLPTFPAPNSLSGDADITELRLYDGANLLYTLTFATAIQLSVGDAIEITTLDVRLGDDTTSGFSNAIELALLNHVFRGTVYTPPANLFFDAYSTAPSVADGSGGTLTDYGSYAQVSVANNATNFPNAVTSTNDSVKSTGAQIDFIQATSDATSNIAAIAVWNEAGRTNLIAVAPLPTSKPVQSGNNVYIPNGQELMRIKPTAA